MPSSAPSAQPDALERLATTQDMVVSRRQLRDLKIGRQLISRRVRAGQWQVVGPHVVVLHTGPLSRTQQYWAGVLHAGPGAALGGVTALEVAGFKGFASEDVVVWAPHGHGRRDLVTDRVTIRVHESRNFSAADIRTNREPPRVRQGPATVDAAAGARSDRACRTILAMSVQQRLVVPPTMRALVLARRNLRRRALILETLDDVEGGSQSLPELEYLRGLRRYGLPEPTRQRVVQVAGGRYYLDVEFDEWLVTVEINGSHHLDVQQKEADDMRRTRLGIGGRLVVDIGSHTVRHDIALAALLTADALFSRGWAPQDLLRDRLLKLAAQHATFAWTSPVAA